jgi:hypothetical protein
MKNPGVGAPGFFRKDKGNMSNTSIAIMSRDDKLKKLVPLLGSDKPGEVVAAAAALDRHLKSTGRDFHWLADAASSAPLGPAPEQHWHTIVLECAEHKQRLSPKDREFLHGLMSYDQPTPKQRKWLYDIERRVRS